MKKPVLDTQTPEQTAKWTTKQGLGSNTVRGVAIKDQTIIGATEEFMKTNGLFHLQNNEITTFQSPTTTRINLIHTDKERLVMATEGGLWVQSSQKWHHLLQDPIRSIHSLGDKIFVVAQQMTEQNLYTLQDVTVSPVDEIKCQELLTILPKTDNDYWFVCRSQIFAGNNAEITKIDLRTTPLWKEATEESENPPPPVYIYDAAYGPDRAAYIIGKTNQLIQMSQSETMILGSGQFSQIVGTENSLYTTTFDGKLQRWSKDKGLQTVANYNMRLEHLTVDHQDRIFVIVAPKQQPYRVERWSPPYDSPDRIWGLENGKALSPGVVAAHPDNQGGLLLETNAGLWALSTE